MHCKVCGSPSYTSPCSSCLGKARSAQEAAAAAAKRRTPQTPPNFVPAPMAVPLPEQAPEPAPAHETNLTVTHPRWREIKARLQGLRLIASHSAGYYVEAEWEEFENILTLAIQGQGQGQRQGQGQAIGVSAPDQAGPEGAPSETASEDPTMPLGPPVLPPA